MTIKEELINKLKEAAKELAKEYTTNLKIELNVNKKDDVIRINISEYNL